MSDRQSRAETGERPESPPSRASPPARRGLVIAGALLTVVLAALDQNIVNTALPRIVGDLGGMEHLTWVVTAFMLTSTATTALYGKLSDVFGRRALLFVAIGIFLAGSFACGAAPSMTSLILFRAIQGVGAGGLFTLAQAVIGDVLPPAERPRYQGYYTGAFALASVAGPVLGGAITQFFSWRWVFYINLPVGLFALTAIAVALPRQRDRKPHAVDWGGAALMTGGTAALLLLLAWGGNTISWLSPPALALAGLTVVMFGAFVWVEKRAADPIVRLGLFANVVYARGVVVGGMLVFAMMGVAVCLPLYFQLVLGMPPATAGMMLMPQVAGMVVTSILGGRAVARVGRPRLFMLAGIGTKGLALSSLALFAWFGAPPVMFLVSMATLGLGMGVAMPNVTALVQNAVPHRELGAATGAMGFVRSLGSALGVASSGVILAQALTGAFERIPGIDGAELAAHGVAALAGYAPEQVAMIADVYRAALTGCFLLSGAVMASALILAIGMPDDRLRKTIEH